MPSAVIAEDEALLRDALHDALREQWPELDIAAACEDGAQALEAIAAHTPDVAFLDIRMPGLSGLDVAAAAAQVSPTTQIVFTTAYDQYAIAAFDHGAVDYLLKPVEPERLAETVRRVQTRIANADRGDPQAFAALLRKLDAAIPPSREREPLTWITAASGRETRLIGIDEVLYFRAEDKYTTVVTADGEALLRTPLKELLAGLDPTRFRQVHRSTVVNLRAIAGVVREDGGRGLLRLKGRPETLAVSQPFMVLFRAM